MKTICKLLSLVLSVLLLMTGCRVIESDIDGNGDTTDAAAEAIVYPKGDGRMVVCLDAGHGFRDIGCDTDLLLGTEAEVNLAVTLLVKDALEKKGIEVILTHDGKTYPSAEKIKSLADGAGVEYIAEDIIENDVFSAYERGIYTSAIAEKEGIDLFISLHVNSIENNPEISRYEIDYYKGNPYAAALGELAETLSGRLDNETVIYADPLEEAFLVTKTGTHPSVLIEMGYATNERDSANLNSEIWRKNFANTLAECVLEWLSAFEK